jgi:hypothetical protein
MMRLPDFSDQPIFRYGFSMIFTKKTRDKQFFMDFPPENLGFPQFTPGELDKPRQVFASSPGMALLPVRRPQTAEPTRGLESENTQGYPLVNYIAMENRHL